MIPLADMLRTSFGLLGTLVALVTGTGCRALLDGDDLDLQAGQGGGGAGAATGSDGSTGAGGGGGDGPATSTGSGGATSSASTSTSTSSSTTTSSTTASTGTGGGICGDGDLTPGEECDDGGVADGDGCSAGCTFEGGFTCAGAIDVGVEHDETVVVATTTTGGTSDAASCQFFTGPSRFFRVTPASDGFLTAWIPSAGTSFVSSMSVRTACDATLLCVDSTLPAGGEVVSVRVQQGVPVWLQVTSPGEGAGGDFTIELTLDRGTCVDPVEIRLEPGSGGAAYGSLAGRGQDTQSSCGGADEDVAYRITGVGAVGGTAIVLPQDDFDAVLYTRPTCATAADEICVDAAGVGSAESLQLDLASPVHLIVDSDTAAGGEFSLNLTSHG